MPVSEQTTAIKPFLGGAATVLGMRYVLPVVGPRVVKFAGAVGRGLAEMTHDSVCSHARNCPRCRQAIELDLPVEALLVEASDEPVSMREVKLRSIGGEA